MLESIVLLTALAGILAVAAIAHQREKRRRIRILKAFEGETVILGVATEARFTWLCYVWVSIVDVPTTGWDDISVMKVSVIGFDDRPGILPAPGFVDAWNTDGIFLHDILSVETSTGEIHHF